MMNWFSPFFIAIGQVLAIVLFLLYEEPWSFLKNPRPIGLTAAFFLIHTILQAVLHNFSVQESMGSLPMLQYIVITLFYYLLFVRLWTRLSLSVCSFIALIFLLADNCIWPLLITVSRRLWGISYLYEGPYPLRIPYILLFWFLEAALMLLLRRLLPSLPKIRLSRSHIVLTLTSVIPFLYIRVISSRLTTQDNKTLQIAMTVCCLVTLITLVSSVGQSSSEYERLQTDRMQYILTLQQQQFQQKLQDIDAVNRKYHDMKNILLYLSAQEHTDEIQTQVRQLLTGIRPYETKISTGNDVIDILLNEKLAVCQQKEITCVPYLDGGLFDFAQPLDLCILFGNALDNAIESCVQIPDPENRQISIRSLQKNSCVALIFRNTFFHRPNLLNGLPATTKKDTKNHGYGLSNIRCLMDKYQGELNCRVENQEFILTLLFPAKQMP